ncbi:MAG: mandelate racemase/muconate lactonizing enzyme family protein [bacterium]|nr:mandelate racemase/muconate lactonizing enzyme family protein [bacterium]
MQNRRTFIQTAAAAGLASTVTASPAGAAARYDQLGRSPHYHLPPVLKSKTGLKIVKIETFTQGATLSFVRITADDGSEGWGQLSTYDADLAAAVLHRKLAGVFLNEDPADLDALVDRAIEANYKYPWSFVCRALSGLDTAVWDWLGKREGKSVCELLGGKPRPFPVYGSSMSREIKPADEAARLKRLMDEKGYAAFKVRVGSVAGHDRDQWPGRTEELIPAVRKAVGDGVDLLADGNSCYTPPRAIEVGRLMEDNGYIHFEEPCPFWELEWTAETAKALTVPVAGGEQDNDLAQWRRMIAMNAVDIVQPDILYVGGVTRSLRVAAMALEKDMPCVPHSANLAMVTLFSLHVMGAILNAGPHVEFSIESTPWTDGLFSPALEVKEGKVMIPAEPGWGVTINPDWLAQAERQVSEL